MQVHLKVGRNVGEDWRLFEDVFEGRTLVVFNLLHGLPELLAGFIPFVNAGDDVLLVHFAAHDEVVVVQVVELRARAVGAVLQVEYELLHVLLLQSALLQDLLLLLEDHLAVIVLPFHLLDLGLDDKLAGTYVVQNSVHLVVTGRANWRDTVGKGTFRSVGRTEAHVTLRELVAGQHLGPGEAKGLHDGRACVSHLLAQPAAWVDGLIQANWGEQGAKEHLGTWVTVLVHKGHPAAGLLLDLGHGLVLQKVG